LVLERTEKFILLEQEQPTEVWDTLSLKIRKKSIWHMALTPVEVHTQLGKVIYPDHNWWEGAR